MSNFPPRGAPPPPRPAAPRPPIPNAIAPPGPPIAPPARPGPPGPPVPPVTRPSGVAIARPPGPTFRRPSLAVLAATKPAARWPPQPKSQQTEEEVPTAPAPAPAPAPAVEEVAIVPVESPVPATVLPPQPPRPAIPPRAFPRPPTPVAAPVPPRPLAVAQPPQPTTVTGEQQFPRGPPGAPIPPRPMAPRPPMGFARPPGPPIPPGRPSPPIPMAPRPPVQPAVIVEAETPMDNNSTVLTKTNDILEQEDINQNENIKETEQLNEEESSEKHLPHPEEEESSSSPPQEEEEKNVETKPFVGDKLNLSGSLLVDHDEIYPDEEDAAFSRSKDLKTNEDEGDNGEDRTEENAAIFASVDGLVREGEESTELDQSGDTNDSTKDEEGSDESLLLKEEEEGSNLGSADSKAVDSDWSAFQSALKDAAISNKLKDYLQELKEKVVTQAQELAHSINTIHEQSSQDVLNKCLDYIGPQNSKKSILEDDEFIQALQMNSKPSLNWEDIREVLSFRSVSFQQKALMQTIKTERDLLLEKIEQILIKPRNICSDRSLESAVESLDQYYKQEEQLLLHRVAFFDEKLNNFIATAHHEIHESRQEVKSNYDSFKALKKMLSTSYDHRKHKFQQAHKMIRKDADEHGKLISSLLEQNMTWGTHKMEEMIASYENNLELKAKQKEIFDEIDESIISSYRRVYERIENSEDFRRPEHLAEEINRIQRAVFAWKQNHTQKMEDRLNYIQLVIEGYYMSVNEELVEELTTLRKIHFNTFQYDQRLRFYLNSFLMKHGFSRRIEGSDADMFMRLKTYTGPRYENKVTNVLSMGSNLRSLCYLAGVDQEEASLLMAELVKRSRNQFVF